MDLFFVFFQLLIGFALVYSFLLSFRESRTARDRRKRRNTNFPAPTSRPFKQIADVEKKWVSRTERKKALQRNSQKQPAREVLGKLSPDSLQAEPRSLESTASSVFDNRRQEDRWEEYPDLLNALDKEPDLQGSEKETKRKSDVLSGRLDKKSLAQAILYKEVLDKPLSLRNKQYH